MVKLCDKRIAAIASALMLVSPGVASAQDAIGGVESLRQEAARSGVSLNVGDRVRQSDSIRTGSDSSVRIAFNDQSNLAIGPTSRALLDRYVYSGTRQAMGLNLTQGVFCFWTGEMDAAAIRINTPTATMGVRGSVVNIEVRNSGSTFTLLDDSAGVWICPRQRYDREQRLANETDDAFRRRIGCRDLNRMGDAANVDNRGNITQSQQSPTQFGLNGQCSSNSSLCFGANMCGTRQAAPFAWPVPLLPLVGVTAAGVAIGGIIDGGNSGNPPTSP